MSGWSESPGQTAVLLEEGKGCLVKKRECKPRHQGGREGDAHAPCRTHGKKLILEVIQLEKDFTSRWVPLKSWKLEAFYRLWNMQGLRATRAGVTLWRLSPLDLPRYGGKTWGERELHSRASQAPVHCGPVSQHITLKFRVTHHSLSSECGQYPQFLFLASHFSFENCLQLDPHPS